MSVGSIETILHDHLHMSKVSATLAKKKRRVKLHKGILLLHDNAPAHRSMKAVHTSMQCGFKILPHPPYSPDLAPSDFFLNPKSEQTSEVTVFP